MTSSIKITAATILIVAAVSTSCSLAARRSSLVAPEQGERHFADIRQLTFGGENAEAYFSADGKRLVFQGRSGNQGCDQEYVMNVDGSHVKRVSNGFGKTTCGYFYGGDTKIFFGSTHGADSACPPKPD